MAYEEDDEDNLEKAADTADSEEAADTPVPDDEDTDSTTEPKEDALPDTEETPDDELEQADVDQEALATHKSPKEEFSEMADEESAEAPKSTAPKNQLDQYKDYMEQYKKLQERRSNADLVNGLIAAGGKIGQSIAGKYSGNFVPDQAGNQMLAKMAERPTQDFEQGQIVNSRGLQLQAGMNAADPASAQSKLVRDYLNQRLFKDNPLPDNVSAQDAMSMMKMIGKPQATHLSQLPMVNQQTGEKTMAVFNPTAGTFTGVDGSSLGAGWVRDYRAQSFTDPATGEKVAFSGGTGKTSGTLTGPGISRPGAPAAGPAGSPPIELNRTMLTAQQAKQVDHTRDKFINEIKDDRNNINATDRTIAALQAGSELGDLPREEQDQLNRAFGQKGHLSDQQVGVTLGKPDWQSQLENVLSIGMHGKLTDENREFLLDTLKVIRDQNQKYIDNKSQIYSNNLYNDLRSSPNLSKSNISRQSISKLLGVDAAAPSNQSQQKMLIDNRDGKLKPIQADKYEAALKAKDKQGHPLFSAPGQ